MAKSKHQLACSLTKKTLTLEGKIKLLDPNKERKQSCQQLVEMFNISKTAAANIKNEASNEELTRGYELADIWNLDETGCFFKALPEKGLAEKKSQIRGGKKSKMRLIIAFFVNAAGEKAIDHWWCGGVKNHVVLKTLRVFPDPMPWHLLLL